MRAMNIAERFLHEAAEFLARDEFHFDVRLILGEGWRRPPPSRFRARA